MSKSWTGERLETFIYNDNTTEHLHRYAVAYSLCRDKEVLDIASGEGYGSNLLSQVAGKVTGVDISKEAVQDAVNKYQKPNLQFKVGSASKIPLPDHSVDVVVSFETIEHHDKHQEMMNEIKRVLRPGGMLIMSSPDKKYYTDERKYTNPFHVKELYFGEFKTLINNTFAHAVFFFQKAVAGSLLLQEDNFSAFREYSGDFEKVENRDDFSPLYNMCIASDQELPAVSSSLYDGKHISEYSTHLAIQKAVADADAAFRGSWTYKIGHSILTPFRMFKRS